jgi:prepilin-type N-terminal cleavage/methylation domain-containing protein
MRCVHPQIRLKEDGFSLMELLVAMSMFAVVMLAILALLDTASNDAYNEQERGVSLTEISAQVEGVAQTLSSAYRVNGPTTTTGGSSDWMDVDVRLPITGGGQVEDRILIVCTVADAQTGYDECLQYKTAVPATGFTAGSVPSGVTGVPVIRYVLNETTKDPGDPVFQGLTDPQATGSRPSYGQVLVRTPGKGQRIQSSYTHQVVLNSGFYIRNLDFGK